MRKLSLLMVAGMVVVGVAFRAAAATGEEAAPEALPQGAATAAAADLEASAIEALGVVEGKPIDSGFVFIDGRYVEAPYTVSRRGRQIFINDVLIYQWPEWPLMDRHVREDPGPPPKEYEKLTSFAEIIEDKEWLNSHLYQKRRYLYEHFPEKEANEKMMEYYRQCPFVASRLCAGVGSCGNHNKERQEGEHKSRPPPPAHGLTLGFWRPGCAPWP